MHPGTVPLFLSFNKSLHSKHILLSALRLEETGKWRAVSADAPSHRLLVVLEGLAGLLVGADLLAALALDVSLLHLLQEEIGPAQPPQHRVRRVCRQEH